MTKTWAEWLTQHAQPPALAPVRDRVLDAARVTEGDLVLDLGAGTGLLAEAVRDRGADVIAVEPDAGCRTELAARGFDALDGRAETIPVDDGNVDAAVCRSVLVYVDSLEAATHELFRVLKPGGRFAAFEPLNRRGTYIHDVIDWSATGVSVADDDRRWLREEDPLSRLEPDDLGRALRQAGFADVELAVEAEDEEVQLTEEVVDAMLDAVGAPGQPSRRRRWTVRYGDEITARLVAHLKAHAGMTVSLRWLSLYAAARKP